MGMGRNSSRIASRRIANNSKDLTTFTGIVSDDDDDADWSLGNDKRKRKKEKNGLKKSKQFKTGKITPTLSQKKNGGSNGSGAGSDELVLTSGENSPSNFEALSVEEKRTLLQQICGVISEHTKKLCTRSIRCPQHTDEQRKEMRANLEAQNSSQDVASSVNVDGDSFEETDNQNLRENLSRWDREGSNHSSPADSASTTSTSSNSRKRESKSKNKGSRSKRERISPSTPE